MNSVSICRWLLVLILAQAPFDLLASHLRAGEITAVRTNCSGRTFLITVTVYIDTGTGVMFGGLGELLTFGDSTWIEVPETPTTPRPDLGPNMGTASFSVLHTYGGPGRYTLTYQEPFRNAEVINMLNPDNTLFYIETQVSLDPFVGCDNTARLLVPPVDKACTGVAWFHNPGAYDVDGDSLSFELTVPRQERGRAVNDYRDPNSREFYESIGLDYNVSNEAHLGPPTFAIDPVTGTLVWDAPGAAGEYNIAFIIKSWRKVNGLWMQLGYVVRDMQILVEDCHNERPELEVPLDICVEAGGEINEEIFGFDHDSDEVMIEAFSQVFGINPSPAVMVPSPPVFQPSSPGSHARVEFHWQTECVHIRERPYQVVFKISDRPDQGPVLTHFKTWNITVVGPAPEWETAAANPGTRSAALTWKPYACENAVVMEIWRRVDSFDFTRPECLTGIPDYLGFTRIGEVPATTTSFLDSNGGKGLAVGARYCYRLLAVYAAGGGESYVSAEACLAPILADAPVVTHVTVDRTDRIDGEITVRWRPAFDLDGSQFPPPYSYEVYRSEGISGAINITKAHPGRLSDTAFHDKPLNTEEKIYNYRIVLYDGLAQLVDTSSVASSVRLEATPRLEKIELKWAADVPWSLRTQNYPTHDIYRGPAGANVSAFELIASVDVFASGFSYVDDGSGSPLKETETYCYRVETRGAYGNPRIAEPLINYSQITCAQPSDDDPPCNPELPIVAMSCEEQWVKVGCGAALFSNTVTWKRPGDADCQADILTYNVYVANRVGDDFILYRENVRDTFFIDSNENLESFARCYKVSAVDRSGNESGQSEAFCFDNCPHFELPNVFTPNGDNCNEFFSAFGDPQLQDCGPADPARCARFVEEVDFSVFNRWGKEVYRTDGKESSIYIRWDGRDHLGAALSSGVYYYTAKVRFATVDPAQSTRTFKGWVHLVRTRDQ